jgi:hypothetical protein
VREYACRGCIRIDADALDELAVAVMLAYLAQPDVFSELRAGSADPAALAAVRAELASARDELADWRNGATGGEGIPVSLSRTDLGHPRRMPTIMPLKLIRSSCRFAAAYTSAHWGSSAIRMRWSNRGKSP